MNAYQIETGAYCSQRNLVICDSMAEAEQIFKNEYPYTQIIEIKLISIYVLLKKGRQNDNQTRG